MSEILKAIKELSLLSHGHKHLPILNKLNINENNKLTFNGNEIKGSEINLNGINELISNAIVQNKKESDFSIILDNSDGKIKKTKQDFLTNILYNINPVEKVVVVGGRTTTSTTTAFTKIIDSFLLDTATNSHIFGELTQGVIFTNSYSNAIKSITESGLLENSITFSGKEVILFATETNSSFFNDIKEIKSQNFVSFSNKITGIITAGITGNTTGRKMFFSTFADSAAYYDYTSFKFCSAFSTPTFGVCAGGAKGQAANNFTNLVSFCCETTYHSMGALTAVTNGIASCADNTLGIFFGGFRTDVVGTIEYITITTLAAAQVWGSVLTTSKMLATGASGSTKGVISGGTTSTNLILNEITYVDFGTKAVSNDFGDLVVARAEASASSNCHYGLQF